jgi:hypothetical protein
LLWHYALHDGEPRVRLADTLHDVSCTSTEILGELSDDGYEVDAAESSCTPAAAAKFDHSPSAATEAASRAWTFDSEGSFFPLTSHVYVPDVGDTGRVRKHLKNSDGNLVTGYVVNYDMTNVESDIQEDQCGEHSADEVFKIVESASEWPVNALPRRSYVSCTGARERSGVLHAKGFGRLSHCAVNLRGEPEYYGVLLTNSIFVAYCLVHDVAEADAAACVGDAANAKPAAAAAQVTPPHSPASPTVDGNHQNVSAAVLAAAAHQRPSAGIEAGSPMVAASPTVVVVSSEERSAAVLGEAPTYGACHHAVTPVRLDETHFDHQTVTPVRLDETHFDETEDDVENLFSHDPEYAFKIRDSCVAVLSPGGPSVAATVIGRIVGFNSRRVQKYVILVPDSGVVTVPIFSVQRCEEAAGLREGTEGDDAQIDDEEEDLTLSGNANESGTLAQELSGCIEHFDVAKMSAHDIWNSILLKRNLCGGLLTRSILKDAAVDHACLPLWQLPTTQEKRVEQKKLQGLDFISHFTPAHKIAWLRVKVFSIVSTNRNSYAKMRVTFNGHTSVSLATAGAPELTDDLRCRIAHLALDPASSKLLVIIFGSRDTLEKTDNRGMNNTALWNDLTKQFVNSRMWQPFSVPATAHRSCNVVDVSVAPPPPGLDATTVQEVFLDIRSDWTRLKDRVFCPTGCNSTGFALLSAVWDNFINGGRLKFSHKVVAMYVFMSWYAAGGALPELCNRTLQPSHQLVLGVQPFKTPEKVMSSASSTSTRKVRGNDDSLQKIATALQNITSSSQSARSPSPLLENKSSSDTLHQGQQGSKRQICLEEPESDLQNFLTQHNLMKWWPELYDKLGVTSIKDLKFLGKEEIVRSLATLPAFPRLKMASLLDS